MRTGPGFRNDYNRPIRLPRSLTPEPGAGLFMQGDLHLFSAVCLGLKILAVAVTASRAPVFAGLICAEHRNGKTVSNN